MIPHMLMGKPKSTNAPAENHATRCGSFPFVDSSRLYQTTPTAVERRVPQRRIRLRKFMTDTVVRRMSRVDDRHSRRARPHLTGPPPWGAPSGWWADSSPDEWAAPPPPTPPNGGPRGGCGGSEPRDFFRFRHDLLICSGLPPPPYVAICAPPSPPGGSPCRLDRTAGAAAPSDATPLPSADPPPDGGDARTSEGGGGASASASASPFVCPAGPLVAPSGTPFESLSSASARSTSAKSPPSASPLNSRSESKPVSSIPVSSVWGVVSRTPTTRAGRPSRTAGVVDRGGDVPPAAAAVARASVLIGYPGLYRLRPSKDDLWLWAVDRGGGRLARAQSPD